MTSSRSLETITAADFRDIRGSRFRLTIEGPEPGAAFEFEVADVTEGAGAIPDGFRRPFSVLFHGPRQPVLPQAIYRLEHDQFGVVELFLVPIGPESAALGERPAMRYEAAFA